MGNVPFVRACEWGDQLKAQRLWQAQPGWFWRTFVSTDGFISAQDVHDAFVFACQRDHVNIARWLMALGPTIPQHCYERILLGYPWREHPAVLPTLEFVRRHADPFDSDVVSQAFWLACGRGHLEMARYMYEVLGANVFGRDDAPGFRYQDVAAWMLATRVLQARWDARRTWIMLTTAQMAP